MRKITAILLIFSLLVSICVFPVSAEGSIVENVKVHGRLAEGEILAGSYDFSLSYDESEFEYKWYVSDSAEGPWDVINGADTKQITATSAVTGNKYVKFAVVTQSGEISSENVLSPEKAPVVSDLNYSTAKAYTGQKLSAIYNYSDENNDLEKGSVITWYAGTAADSDDFLPIGTGKTIDVTDNYEGKYIKYSVTVKNDAPALKESVGTSVAIGPVTDAFKSTNRLTNGDVETGTTDGWKTTGSKWNVETPMQVYSDDKHSGSYSMMVDGSATGDVQSFYYQPMSVEDGVVYLTSGYVKLISADSANDFTTRAYTGLDKVYGDIEKYTVNSSSWTNVIVSDVGWKTASASGVGLYSYTAKTKYLVDDMYNGFLFISDIETKEIADTKIPQSGTTTISVTDGKVLNQLGTQHGLWNEEVVSTVVKGAGVTVSGNDVVISSEAAPGQVIVKLSCTPSINIDPFEKYITFNLYSDTTPRVENVTLVGEIAEGKTIGVDYDFYQAEDKADASTYKWFVKNPLTGEKTYIPNATSRTYVVEDAYKDEPIGCEVAPATFDGLTGETVDSDVRRRVAACSAENVRVTGRLVEGQTLTGSYTFVSVHEKAESEYYWCMSQSPEGPWTVIPNSNAKEIIVSSAMTGNKYVRFVVIPNSTGGEGFETHSENILAPEKAPGVSNLTFNKAEIFTKDTLSPVYDYTDENGDTESGSVITWYIGSAEDANDFTQEGTGATFTVKDRHKGKFIKYSVTPKNNAPAEKVGATVESDAIGPVQDYLAQSNLLTNYDFESGNTDGWEATGLFAEDPALKISEDAYSGNYSMYVAPQGSLTSGFFQTFASEIDKVYIASAYIKAVSVKEVDLFRMRGKTGWENLYASESYVVDSSSWTQVISTHKCTKTEASNGVGFGTFQNSGAQSFLVDDMYFSELVVSDIETREIPDTKIPDQDSISILVTNGKVYNQLGTQHGLWDEKAKVEVVSGGGNGVTISGNYVNITNEAVTGEVVLKVSCTPEIVNIPGFEKTVTFNLIPGNDKTPKVSNVTVSGDVVANNTLTLDYDFYQVEGKADLSTYKWFVQDTVSGSKTYILSATSRTYTVDSVYTDKFIGCEVTPATEGDIYGSAVFSNLLRRAIEPLAENIKATGKISVGEVIKGVYDFVDYNNDNEGTSSYSWYISDTIDGAYTPIDGADSINLTLTDEMTNKYLKFAVKPVSVTAPANGVLTFSEPILGPAKPTVNNISVSQSGLNYKGDYDYYHIHGIDEKNTQYRWYADGVLVSTSANYVVNFSGTKLVTFEVIPGCDGIPAQGDPVSTSFYVTGSNGAGAGSGGGAGGGGFGGGGSAGGGTGGSGGTTAGGTDGFTSGVTSINGMDYQQPTETPEDTKPENSQQIPSIDTTDIVNHWGREYIEELSDFGIMGVDAKGNFNPDKPVCRGDMIGYLFEVFDFDATEYKGVFSDISADSEYANMIQTFLDEEIISPDSTFRPYDNISREELCKILYIALEKAGKIENAAEDKISFFEDYNSISDWAKVYVNALYQAGIIKGVSETVFSPGENVTKAQAATLFTRILKY